MKTYFNLEIHVGVVKIYEQEVSPEKGYNMTMTSLALKIPYETDVINEMKLRCQGRFVAIYTLE